MYLSLLMCIFSFSSLGAIVSEDVNEDTYYKDDDYAPLIIWSGSGYYYGVYFSNENDYNHWCQNNRKAIHDYNQQERRNNRQGDRENQEYNRSFEKERGARPGGGGGHGR